MPVNGTPMPGRMPPETEEERAEVRGTAFKLIPSMGGTPNNHNEAGIWLAILGADPLSFNYKNWYGKMRRCNVIPRNFQWGNTEHHPGEKQWFLKAYDMDRQADRDYAFKDIIFDDPRFAKALEVLAFFASVIKSGEGWSDECQSQLSMVQSFASSYITHPIDEPNEGNSD